MDEFIAPMMKHKFIKFEFNLLAYIALVIVFTVLIIAPIFICDKTVRSISDQGILGDTLRTSINLKIAESICIGSTLPMLSDIFLDRFSRGKEISGRMNMMQNRALFIIAFSMSSIIYLTLGDHEFMPFLYICLYRTKILIVGAVLFFAVSKGTVSKAWKINEILFSLPVVFCGIFNVCEIYNLIYPDSLALSVSTSVTLAAAFISFVAVEILWLYYLLQQYRREKRLDDEEITEFVYMAASLFYIVACELVNAINGFTISWYETGDSILIGYAIVQLLFILIATVLPGRLLRNVAEV